MKHLYDINKLLIIITFFLYFTFWGGIMSQIVLGCIQIIMSVTIILNFKKLSRYIKKLFVAYIILVPVIILLLKLTGQNHTISGFDSLFLVLLITMCLALFHLGITYEIKKLLS